MAWPHDVPCIMPIIVDTIGAINVQELAYRHPGAAAHRLALSIIPVR